MVFAVAGYMGTGSSAVVDLLEEYDNCTTAGVSRIEHIVFYTPHGLFDLEDRLLLNNTIHNSDAAISDFYYEMKRLNDYDFGWCGGLQKRYGNQFMQLVEKFIAEIVEFQQKGFWSYDFIERKRTLKGIVKDTLHGRYDKKNEFGMQIKLKKDQKILYSFVDSHKFYSAAKEFVYGYFNMIRKGSEKHLVLNQILLPHNLYRIPRYFGEDLRVIVCDRDARDMYILSKYIWPHMGCEVLMPSEVDEFIKFYRGLHNSEIILEDSRIKRIHFEDLIYKYDKTVNELERFLNLTSDNHSAPKTCLKPEESICNTQNFRIKSSWEKEVERITEQMPEKIYQFPYRVQNSIDNTFDK